MSNKVLVELAYNKRVLIAVEDLATLLNILNGSPIANYTYIAGIEGRVDYLEDEDYNLEYRQAPNVCYKTEEQVAALEKQGVEAAPVEEPSE